MLKNSELLLAASVPLLWGFGFTFTKAGLNEFPPLFLMGLRFSLASLVLIWFAPIPRGQLKQIFWISFVGSTIIELLEVVVEPGNAIEIVKIIIRATAPIPDPIKIFLCDEMFVFGFVIALMSIMSYLSEKNDWLVFKRNYTAIKGKFLVFAKFFRLKIRFLHFT